MKRILTIGAIFALAFGFASCNKDKINGPDTPEQTLTDTYVGLTIKFPSAFGSTRADGLPKDYNWNGEWQGQDDIKSIKVYIVTDEKKVSSSNYDLSNFDNFDIKDGVLTPNIAVKANAGEEVRAYVIINDVNGKFITEVDKLAAGDFETKFADVVAEVASIDEVAKTTETSVGSGKYEDIIVMTNDVLPKEPVTIEANVSEEKAIEGKNQIVVNVSRVASRGIVTVDEDLKKDLKIEMVKTIIEKDTKGKVISTTTKKATTSTLRIGDISYKVSGGGKKVYAMKHIVSEAPTENGMEVPADIYDFVPDKNVEWSALYEDETASANFLFNAVDTYFKSAQKISGNTTNNVISALVAEKDNSQFVLPVTHANEGYRKGNTTMFEIRVPFRAENNTEFFPEAEDLSNHKEGSTLYYGVSDGFFYSTEAKAKAMDASAIKAPETAKQEVKEFKNGYMYYYLWLNPNKPYSGTDKITMSPTVRNQVYHAHITGFKELGLTDKEEIKPEETLETDKTYLSVKVKVLNWGIHSYEVNLGNRY